MYDILHEYYKKTFKAFIKILDKLELNFSTWGNFAVLMAIYVLNQWHTFLKRFKK